MSSKKNSKQKPKVKPGQSLKFPYFGEITLNQDSGMTHSVVSIQELIGPHPEMNIRKLEYSIIPPEDGTITIDNLLAKVNLKPSDITNMCRVVEDLCAGLINEVSKDRNLSIALKNLLTLNAERIAEITTRAAANNISVLRQITLVEDEATVLGTYSQEDDVKLLHEIYSNFNKIWKEMSKTLTISPGKEYAAINFNFIILHKITEAMILLGVAPEVLLASGAIDYIASTQLQELAARIDPNNINSEENGRISALKKFLLNSEESCASDEGRVSAFTLSVALNKSDILGKLFEKHICELIWNKEAFTTNLISAFMRGNYDVCSKFLSAEVLSYLNSHKIAFVAYLILFRSGTETGPRLLELLRDNPHFHFDVYNKVLSLVNEAEYARAQSLLEPMIQQKELVKWNDNPHALRLNLLYGILEINKIEVAENWIKFLFDNNLLYLRLHQEMQNLVDAAKKQKANKVFEPYVEQLTAKRDAVLASEKHDFKQLALAIDSLAQKEKGKFIEKNYARLLETAESNLNNQDIYVQKIANEIVREKNAQELIAEGGGGSTIGAKPEPKKKKSFYKDKKAKEKPEPEKIDSKKIAEMDVRVSILNTGKVDDNSSWEDDSASGKAKESVAKAPPSKGVTSNAKGAASPGVVPDKKPSDNFGKSTVLKSDVLSGRSEGKKNNLANDNNAKGKELIVNPKSLSEWPKLVSTPAESKIVPSHHQETSNIPTHTAEVAVKDDANKKDTIVIKVQEVLNIQFGTVGMSEKDAAILALQEENNRLKKQLEEARKESSNSDSGSSGNSAESVVEELKTQVLDLKEKLEGGAYTTILQQAPIYYNPDGSCIQNGITYYPQQVFSGVTPYGPLHYNNAPFQSNASITYNQAYPQRKLYDPYQSDHPGGGGNGGGRGYRGGKKRADFNDKEVDASGQQSAGVNLLSKLFKGLLLAITTKLEYGEVINQEQKQYEEALAEAEKQSSLRVTNTLEEFAERPALENITYSIEDRKAIFGVVLNLEWAHHNAIFDNAKLPGEVFNELPMMHHI